MSPRLKTVLLRLSRVATASAIGAASSYILSPAVLDYIPTQFSTLLVATLPALVVAAEKWLRYGSDPGEVKIPSKSEQIAALKNQVDALSVALEQHKKALALVHPQVSP